ncbi:hypothetical protein BB561_002249 [Smittium simulii]|uniref:M-phase inducer phosphatase n=1 Tax=Smittium simulii TaxID=133385 RepID=A0A2T9YR01_9FUNG|nr:hypothetical protein BB561_002249 [Smittium simulii]
MYSSSPLGSSVVSPNSKTMHTLLDSPLSFRKIDSTIPKIHLSDTLDMPLESDSPSKSFEIHKPKIPLHSTLFNGTTSNLIKTKPTFLNKRNLSFNEVEESIFFTTVSSKKKLALSPSLKLPFPHPNSEIICSKSVFSNYNTNSLENKPLLKSRTLSAFSMSIPQFKTCDNEIFKTEPSINLKKTYARPIKRALSHCSSSDLFNESILCLDNVDSLEKSSKKSSCAKTELIPSIAISSSSIRHISNHTMVKVLEGEYINLYDSLLVIDCRFPYEYQGGHIQDAKNINSVENLEKIFFNELQSDKRYLVIFHCEFSIKRAPSMANYLRKRDRELNAHRYPKLSFPDIYVLQGGYNKFFQNHKQLCNPCNYITMDDINFTQELQVHFSNFERQHKRSKCTETSSFNNLIQSPTSNLRICRSNSANFSSNVTFW